MSKATIGIALVIIGVILNNVAYLQDLWLGQPAMTLDSWRAFGALIVSIGIVVAGLVLIGTALGERTK